MKNHFKVFRYFLCLSVLLLTSFNLQSQPNLGYLSEESIETLDRVEREMEYWSDLSGVLIFGTVVSLAASEPVIITAQLGVDLETPAEALKGIPQAQKARVSDIISLHIVENGNYFNEEERERFGIIFWNY